MNSPDPGSPISTDTSGSPPPDDYQLLNRDPQQVWSAADARLLTNISTSTSGSSKRRLPGGPPVEGTRRDPKSRRREDAFTSPTGSRRIGIEGQGGQALGSNTFQSRGEYTSRRDKEELIDLSLIEQLRQDFGDPFLESGLKQVS
ncbi:hypothetical protein JVU11DRAFT_3396 [Chiua virens]|nr:hypothetical protein JVU11DRAFT_3396 [Chiua virens]